MIHSLSGGVITQYDNLVYVFVRLDGGEKAWYISPFPFIAAGDRVRVPFGRATSEGEVVRVENVTAQTAPMPVGRTREVEAIVKGAE